MQLNPTNEHQLIAHRRSSRLIPLVTPSLHSPSAAYARDGRLYIQMLR
jgi:hypothetical protein